MGYGSIMGCVALGNGENGIGRGTLKLEWHISKFDFCNGISLSCGSCNGIDPINPRPGPNISRTRGETKILGPIIKLLNNIIILSIIISKPVIDLFGKA
jgi:hypothetical protein